MRDAVIVVSVSDRRGQGAARATLRETRPDDMAAAAIKGALGARARASSPRWSRT